MTALLTAHIRNPGCVHCVWNTNKVTCFTVTTATMVRQYRVSGVLGPYCIMAPDIWAIVFG